MITQPQIRAILFDMDGVVVDSMQIHFDIWEQLLPEMKARRPTLDRKIHFGLAGKVILRELIAERDGRPADEKEVEYWHRRKVELTLPVAGRDARPIAGFPEFARRVRARGLPTALASAATRDFIEAVLTKMQVRDLFDAIVSVNDVKQPKPDPEIFLKAARLLNVPIANCLVVEDSLPGIQAGIAAGAICCALLSLLTVEDVAPTGVPVIARDYDDLAKWLGV